MHECHAGVPPACLHGPGGLGSLILEARLLWRCTCMAMHAPLVLNAVVLPPYHRSGVAAIPCEC